MSFSSTNNCQPISPQKTTIRNALASDISDIAETVVYSFYNYSGIFNLLYPLLQLTVGEDLRFRLHSSSALYRCLVATITDEQSRPSIAGTVEISLKNSFWSPHSQYPYISNLAVKDIYRRQGIARQLLEKCESIAGSWGYDAVQLHVLNHNNSAKELYLSSGYQIIREETSWNGTFFYSSSRLLLRKKIIAPQKN